MVGKILKSLTRGGLLDSHRGSQGGYTLNRPPEEINVAEIVGALEGPIAIAECVEESEENCNIERLCPVRGNWQKINEAVKDALASVTLAEMAQPMTFAPPVSIQRADAV